MGLVTSVYNVKIHENLLVCEEFSGSEIRVGFLNLYYSKTNSFRFIIVFLKYLRTTVTRELRSYLRSVYLRVGYTGLASETTV